MAEFRSVRVKTLKNITNLFNSNPIVKNTARYNQVGNHIPLIEHPHQILAAPSTEIAEAALGGAYLSSAASGPHVPFEPGTEAHGRVGDNPSPMN